MSGNTADLIKILPVWIQEIILDPPNKVLQQQYYLQAAHLSCLHYLTHNFVMQLVSFKPSPEQAEPCFAILLFEQESYQAFFTIWLDRGSIECGGEYQDEASHLEFLEIQLKRHQFKSTDQIKSVIRIDGLSKETGFGIMRHVMPYVQSSSSKGETVSDFFASLARFIEYQGYLPRSRKQGAVKLDSFLDPLAGFLYPEIPCIVSPFSGELEFDYRLGWLWVLKKKQHTFLIVEYFSPEQRKLVSYKVHITTERSSSFAENVRQFFSRKYPLLAKRTIEKINAALESSCELVDGFPLRIPAEILEALVKKEQSKLGEKRPYDLLRENCLVYCGQVLTDLENLVKSDGVIIATPMAPSYHPKNGFFASWAPVVNFNWARIKGLVAVDTDLLQRRPHQSPFPFFILGSEAQTIKPDDVLCYKKAGEWVFAMLNFTQARVIELSILDALKSHFLSKSPGENKVFFNFEEKSLDDLRQRSRDPEYWNVHLVFNPKCYIGIFYKSKGDAQKNKKFFEENGDKFKIVLLTPLSDPGIYTESDLRAYLASFTCEYVDKSGVWHSGGIGKETQENILSVAVRHFENLFDKEVTSKMLPYLLSEMNYFRNLVGDEILREEEKPGFASREMHLLCSQEAYDFVEESALFSQKFQNKYYSTILESKELFILELMTQVLNRLEVSEIRSVEQQVLRKIAQLCARHLLSYKTDMLRLDWQVDASDNFCDATLRRSQIALQSTGIFKQHRLAFSQIYPDPRIAAFLAV